MKRYLHRLRDGLNYVLDEIFAFISTPRCAGCRSFLDNPHEFLCDNCRLEFDFRGGGPVCLICGLPENTPCSCQTEKDSPVPGVFFWGNYTEIFRQLIHQFKFNGHLKLGDYMIDKALKNMAGKLRDQNIDLIIPVPMTAGDKRKRGFNQTEILARAVAKSLHKPANRDLLKKIRKTQMQAGLGANDRWLNVADAFAAVGDGRIAGKSILLVDDIVTTGATCFYCAKALYSAGANKVTVFSLVFNVDEKAGYEVHEDGYQWQISKS